MKTRPLLLVAALSAACVLAVRADSLMVVRTWLNCAVQMFTSAPPALPYAAPPAREVWRSLGAAERLANVRARLLPKLPEQLAAMQSRLGRPAFIRIFKESHELELIACVSGTLGPKTREGDMQAPEGFYRVSAKQLNPASNYHLAFNIGYPNEYDLAQQSTGSLIMVHGDVCSVGCFAMTDPVIEEIYLVIEAALKNGGSVPVHVFPFRMTQERMGSGDAANREFWMELLPGYEVFEKERRVPGITVADGKYVVR